MSVKKILYVRCGPYALNFDSYNLQEIGLGKAFCKAGYDFDLIYYSKENDDQMIKIGDRTLTILWRKGIKILRTGIYPFLYKVSFLSKYDIIITSEYSQITSYILAKKHDNVYLYNGPYYNMFKIPFVEPIYDRLFCKKINERVKKTFCKTQMSADYIRRKGITNTEVVGVGLDVSKFERESQIETETQILLDKMKNHRNILYVGSIIPRKNVEFLLKVFVELKKQDESYQDVQLVIVGKSDTSYINKCKSLITDDVNGSVIWCDFIKNAQLKFVYQAAQLFTLPSVYEIFGMVLLEAMYFGLPVISSDSAGAGTLIKNKKNGLIIKEFNIDLWVTEIIKVLDSDSTAYELGKEAEDTIKNEFLWDKISEKMILSIQK